MCTKRNHDLLVYALGVSGSCGVPVSTCVCCFQVNEGTSPTLAIEHVASFGALGFVQASKQHKKLFLVSDDLRLAVIAEHSRYAFIYQRPASTVDAFAPQHIIQLPVATSDAKSDVIYGLRIFSSAGKNNVGVLTEDALTQAAF